MSGREGGEFGFESKFLLSQMKQAQSTLKLRYASVKTNMEVHSLSSQDM